MGVNAIVIIENSKRITRRAFVAGMQQDPWGRHLICQWQRHPDTDSWGSFKWQGRRYFTLHCAPRYRWLGLAGFDANGQPRPWQDSPVEAVSYEPPQPHIDPDNPYHLTFLKAMLAAERLAGGPVMVSNDVVCASSPGKVSHREGFSLPTDLDWQLNSWREVEAYAVAKPGLVF